MSGWDRARRAAALPGRGAAAIRRLGRAAGAAWRRRRAVALAALLLAVLAAALAAGWAVHTAAGLDLERVQATTRVYAAGLPLEAGLAVEAADLAATLRRLDYQEVTGRPRRAGQFRRGVEAWEVFLHPRDDPAGHRPARQVRLVLDGPRVAAVVDPETGASLAGLELEPEVLADLGDSPGQVRRPVRLADVPRHLVQAVLAAEDHRFFDHAGVDLRAILRALWVNLRRGEVREGGSTLTQQLVKNQLLHARRTWDRKLREAAVALALEWRAGKARILEAYLNTVYLGQHGAVAVYGVGAAAERYAGKSVDQLTLAEAALLAGMIRAPNSYAPLQDPERARERRDAVLERLAALGWIDAAALAHARGEPLRVRRATPGRLRAPYFLDLVRAEAEPLAAGDGSPPGGLRIYTTLDLRLQTAAETALARGLDRLESRVPRPRRRGGPRLEGALVALDPVTGEIRALVGGRDYGQSQFNRAVHARRQPGSAFKPFVYLAALRAGPRGEPPRLTAASLVEDRPLAVRVGRETWRPRNFEDRYEGTVSVRRALEQSLNAATVRVAEAAGLEAVVRAARDVGLRSPMAPVPALALGSFEVTPLELAAAYAALAGGGPRVRPVAVRAVADAAGSLLARPARGGAVGIRAEEAAWHRPAAGAPVPRPASGRWPHAPVSPVPAGATVPAGRSGSAPRAAGHHRRRCRPW